MKRGSYLGAGTGWLVGSEVLAFAPGARRSRDRPPPLSTDRIAGELPKEDIVDGFARNCLCQQ
jgi:hypothetical protein